VISMAYISIDRKKGEEYIRIMESVVVNGKKTKRTLHSLGKVSDYTPEILKRIGRRLFELGGGDFKALLGPDIKELTRINYGYFQCINKGIKFYGLDQTIRRVQKNKRIKFDLYQCLLLMLVERLHDPSSKRQNYFNQSEYLGLQKVELHQIYRSLDYLSDAAKIIQQKIYEKGRNLFNQKLDVVFYDVTTFYFHSDKADELRAKGFSKDGKQGKVQIVFGLLIDKHKQPIGYQIYKGNFFEGHTFRDALEKLKKAYAIDKVIVVADRGMLNKNNIQLTVENSFEFILGEKLRMLPATVKSYLIQPVHYKSEWVYDKDGEEVHVRYCAIKHEERTIIGTWSDRRAAKDKNDREEKLEKALMFLNKPSQLSKKAKSFFIKDEATHKYSLDEDKIKAAAQYDGYLAISTNTTDLATTEILDHYRHLFQIEQTFRTFKSHLETRPMFHWTEKRIEGHICMCYISYTIHNFLRQRLAAKKVKLSDSALRRNLDKMQLSLIETGGKQFYIRSANKEHIPNIVQKLGLKPLPSFFHKDQIINYL